MVARRGVLLVFLVVVCALLAAIVVGMRIKITTTREELVSSRQGIEDSKADVTTREKKRDELRTELQTVRGELTAAQEESRSLNDELANLKKEEERRLKAKSAVQEHSIAEWESIGDEATRSGDLEDAAKAFSQAITLDPKSAALYHKRGTARRRLGDFADSIKDFDKALQLSPGYARAMVGRGLAESNMYKDVQSAIDGATKALRINPELQVALDVRAEGYIKQGKFHRALIDDKRLLKMIDADTPMYVRCTQRIEQAKRGLTGGQ